MILEERNGASNTLKQNTHALPTYFEKKTKNFILKDESSNFTNKCYSIYAPFNVYAWYRII